MHSKCIELHLIIMPRRPKEHPMIMMMMMIALIMIMMIIMLRMLLMSVWNRAAHLLIFLLLVVLFGLPNGNVRGSVSAARPELISRRTYIYT